MAQDIDWEKGAFSNPQGSEPDWESGEFAEPKKPTRSLADWGKDIATTALKGAIGVPEALVGLADIATSGQAGKALENAGVRFNEANQIADSWKSDSLKSQQKEFQDAQGIGGKAVAALSNPGLVASTVAESIPSMFLGGALAKGIGLAAPALAGRAGLTAAGEGLIGAGSLAESVRQQTPDGLLTPTQSALAAGAGVATAGLGALGARAGKALGVGDIDSMIANGATQGVAREGMGLANRVGRGALSEGVLEEMPQSLSETAFENVALGKPVTEGMDEAAVLGTLSGGLMGGVAGGLSRPAKPSQQMGIDPNAGPLSRAAASAVDSQPVPSAEPTQSIGGSITGTAPESLMGRASDPLAAQIMERRQQEAVDATPAQQSEPVPLEQRSLDELRQAFRSAQDPAIRKTLAAEIRKRREAMPDPLAQPQQEISLEPQAVKPVETSTEKPEAPAAEQAPAELGQPLTNTGTNMLGRGADPLQSIIQGQADARRAADELRGTTGASTVTGGDITPSGVESPVADVRSGGRNDDAGTAQPDANGVDGRAVGSAAEGSTALTQGDVKEWSSTSFDSWKRQGMDRGTASGWTIFYDHVENTYRLGRKVKDRNEAGGGYVRGEVVTKQFKTAEDAKSWAKGQVTDIKGSNDKTSTRPDNWRGNAIKAGKVARSLGLDPKGKRLKEIVAEIDAVDAGGGVAAKPVSREQAIRDAWRKEPRTIGKWTPISVEAEGQKADMLVNQKRAGGDKDGALHVVNIRMGKMLKDMEREPIAYTFRLTADNRLVEEGIPTVATPGQIAAWKGAGFALDDKPANVKNTPSSTAGTEAQASPVEARAPEGGNAAADTGVPAAPGAGDVQADGVKAEAKKDAAPAAQTERYEAGKALTQEQRKTVLASLVDVYKQKGADREMKGFDQNGNERFGYVHSPDLFEKSDITGSMVRYYVTLPDGRKAHPTELFPEYTQSDIDAEMQRREQEERNKKSADESRLRVLKSRIADSLGDANRIFNKQNPKRDYIPATLTNGTQFVRTAPETAERDAELLGDGWRVQAPAAQAEKPAEDDAFMGVEDDAPIFYSALRKEIEGLNLKSAPFLGWHGQLQGLVRAGKVKADELEWTGISEWLKLQTGKVSKEDVLAYLDANGVQVTETVLGGDGFYRDANGNRVFDDETGDYIGSKTPGTKYQNYTLPGGENYREVLLTLPVRSGGRFSGAALEEERFVRALKAKYGADVLDNEEASSRMTDEEANKLFRLSQATHAEFEAGDGYLGSSEIQSYESSHWDQKNVLAHIRVNDRTDAQGRKVLFVEEIQSDMAQDKRRGKTEFSGPFIDSTDKWLALSLKRIMKMAVDGGYDAVAFVNGEQSAERYDLSKQVDQVSYSDDGVLRAFQKRTNVITKKATPEELPDLIGKEVAQRLLDAPMEDGRRVLMGESLKVGGTGMIAFYDKIVPAAVKDVLKKVGGGQMEEVGIAAVENGLTVRPIDSPFGKFVVVDGNGKQVGLYETESEAKAYMAQRAKPQPGFTITDSMREKVAGGLPLFAGTKDKAKRQGTPVDRAIMDMAGEGREANEILSFIAKYSKSPYRRQLAQKLLATGANPAVSLGGEMGGGAGFRFLAKYSRKNHEVTLSEAAADRAEQIFLHETVHSATLLALDKGGLIATQMRRLAANVYKDASPEMRKMYGLVLDKRTGEVNVGEFVAEAFTNPQFQKALKGMKADNGSLWDRLVNIVRRILGMEPKEQDALSAALDLGAKVMRENMPLRAARSFRAEDGPAFAGADQTETPEFKRWFGDSKVVDSAGKPLVVYHGTTRGIPNVIGTPYFYMTESRAEAKSYAGEDVNPRTGEKRSDRKSPTGEVGEFYVSLQNPVVLPRHQRYFLRDVNYLEDQIAEWKAQGYDGVIMPWEGGEKDGVRNFIAFRPEQIKSATGNRGTFDPNDPDIAHFGIADAVEQIGKQAAVKPVVQALNDTFKVRGKIHWWHKTVGTPFNLAERVPEFKRVFNSVQDFINSVSFYGAEAAAMAPKIIPKLESWKDLGKSPIKAEDNKAIATPIFEGTLAWMRDESGRPVKVADMQAAADKLSADEKAQRLLRSRKISPEVLAMWRGLPLEQFQSNIETRYTSEMLRPGVVWKDSELRSLFKLNDKQIGLYREFRAATDKSLTDLAMSDILQFAGKDADPIKDQVMGMNLAEGSETVRDYLLSLADSDPDRRSDLIDTANAVIDKANRVQDLMDIGYAPLQRFGRFTVYAKDENGEQLFFGMYEDRRAAARAARQMREQYPGAKVETGMMSEEAYKMFQGISPETLEIFGTMLGMDSQADGETNKAFQTYLKLAKSNRSALKRLIERKGISGYSEDASRVLASFIYSNARQTASNLHVGEIMNGVNDIPRDMGEAKDAAVKLARYTMDPQEEAQALRGLLFAQYLGGSIASAAINALQPAQVTFPYLSQFVGAKKSASLMTGAVRDALKKSTGDPRLDAELKKAEEEGIVSPQEIFQLMAQAQGKATLKAGDGTKAGDAMAAASNTLSRLSLGWGKVFSIPEQFNRRTTFIAAYRTAKETGEANPYEFAKQAVKETQLVYNKGNRPEWARGTIGALAFTFKTYSISYVELLQRMAASGPEGRRAALLMVGVLFIMAGAGGLPGVEDAEDVVDGIAQRVFGLNFQTRQKRQEWLADTFGEGGARFIENGLSGLPWSPTDVSGRLGLGNLIPGTGLFVKKENYGRDVAEIAGPAADMTKRFLEGAGLLLQGEVLKAGEIVSPTAVRNMIQGGRMLATDQYTDTKGRKVIDTTPAEGITKMIGFQPADVARVQEATGTTQRMIALNKIRESEIADKWAKGLAAGDADVVQEARDELRKWNESNPESPIRINMPQLFRRVRALKEDKATRIARTAPKEIRQDVRRALEQGQ